MSNPSPQDLVAQAFDALPGRDKERIARLLVAVRKISRSRHVNMQEAQYIADMIERNEYTPS